MRQYCKVHPAITAGWACLLSMFLLCSALAAESDNAAQLLKQADSVKSSNNPEFSRLLARLDDNPADLSKEQQLFLRYLNAWQTIYAGNYDAGIRQLDTVVIESGDSALRVRASVTAINALTIASRYEEALVRLSQLLDVLPQVSDKHAREQAYEVASLVYGQVGQYDLAISFADMALLAQGTDSGPCIGTQMKLDALYKSGRLRTLDNRFQDGIDLCEKQGERLFANLIRTSVVKILLEQHNPAEAIKLLQTNYPEVQQVHYPRLTSEFDSLMAQAYWQSGNSADANKYAQLAVDDSVKHEVTQPIVDAYRILYQVAQKRGDYQSALGFHEKFAAADKGYLTDESTKALAYQMVHQQVQAKKLQIVALSKQNQLLQLRQTVDKQSAETRELYIVLLITVLGFIALWAYRTKRSEIKFMKLARRDSLTGIFNHQHFIDAATDLLQYCARSERNACVLVIDLDHFKLVNDTHGHAMGDLILQRMVAACQKHLRSMDIFGRLGGEEFGIALADCSLDMAIQQADDLRLAIACIASAEDGAGFPVHASFGIASSDCSGYILRQLMAHADSALYRAKNEGRNRIVVFNSAVGLSGGQSEDDSLDAEAATADPA